MKSACQMRGSFATELGQNLIGSAPPPPPGGGGGGRRRGEAWLCPIFSGLASFRLFLHSLPYCEAKPSMPSDVFSSKLVFGGVVPAIYHSAGQYGYTYTGQKFQLASKQDYINFTPFQSRTNNLLIHSF